ncbi:hypothetical protein FRC09_001482 [Ceratobasidium sp. 395]|nr:hypothetical protein FRC09_001482 [Ceratobasidium sp. 395]
MAQNSPQVIHPDLTYLQRALSVTDIISLVARSAPDHRPRQKVSRYLKRGKKQLLQILLEDDQYWAEELYKIAIENKEEQRRSKRTKWRKRGVQVWATQRRAAEEERSSGEFLDPSASTDILQSYAEPHAAATNAALEHRICAVCARRRVYKTRFAQ